MQREEGQFAQHMQTALGNIGAYQTAKQVEVGIAGAEALGKMGAAGGANANLGGGGMNMAGMMANWQKASEVAEINSLFDIGSGITPPPIP